jgi:hypothetical protein
MELIRRADETGCIIAVNSLDRLGIGEGRQSIHQFESQLPCDVFVAVCHLGGPALDKETATNLPTMKQIQSERIRRGIAMSVKQRKERCDKLSRESQAGQRILVTVHENPNCC